MHIRRLTERGAYPIENYMHSLIIGALLHHLSASISAVWPEPLSKEQTEKQAHLREEDLVMAAPRHRLPRIIQRYAEPRLHFCVGDTAAERGGMRIEDQWRGSQQLSCPIDACAPLRSLFTILSHLPFASTRCDAERSPNMDIVELG